jgi:hypothetical protein
VKKEKNDKEKRDTYRSEKEREGKREKEWERE